MLSYIFTVIDTKLLGIFAAIYYNIFPNNVVVKTDRYIVNFLDFCNMSSKYDVIDHLKGYVLKTRWQIGPNCQ